MNPDDAPPRDLAGNESQAGLEGQANPDSPRRWDTLVGLEAKIVREAVRLFATRGYHGTSIRELAEACGCTKPSLYYYFRSKEQLYRDVAGFELQRIESMIRQVLDAGGSVRDRMIQFVGAFFDPSRDWLDVVRFLTRIEMRVDTGAPEIDLSGARHLHHALTAELVEQGIANGEIHPSHPAVDCAMALAGQIHFLTQMHICGDPCSIEQTRTIIDMVFFGIAHARSAVDPNNDPSEGISS